MDVQTYEGKSAWIVIFGSSFVENFGRRLKILSDLLIRN